MLPVSRKDEHLYPVPKFDLVKGDVKDFKNDLIGFHEQFSDCFHRSESRENFSTTWPDNSANWKENPLNPSP
jgi:hypothetical protein